MKITIKNFQSIETAELVLKVGVNVLIGPNGAGKTCALRSLKFIRDVLDLGAAMAVARCGGTLRTFRRGTKSMSFKVQWSYGNRMYRRRRTPHRVEWEFHIRPIGPDGISTLASESLRVIADAETPVEVLSFVTRRQKSSGQMRGKFTHAPILQIGSDLVYHHSNASRAKKIRSVEHFFARQMKGSAKSSDRSFMPELWVDEMLNRGRDRLRLLSEFNIQPEAARQSAEHLPTAQIEPTGHGLASVVHALESQQFHTLGTTHSRHNGRTVYLRSSGRTRSQLVDVLARTNDELAKAVGSVDAVFSDFDLTNGRRFVKFRSGERTFFPAEVSDGTIKWLCLLLSIFVPSSQTYLLEEPENFLHPWMQQRLIELMREEAESRKMIYVLTSHSVTVLNAAKPAEVSVVTFGRRGTRISPVSKVKDVVDVLENSEFGVGDLWVSGALGGVPAGDFGE